jgi:tRNA-dihydrouridine synthase A
VMLGRAAYHNPWLLAAVDQQLFDAAPTVAARQQVVAKMLPYVEARLQDGVPLNHMTRHMLGLFHEQPGGKRFRRHLSENAHRAGAGLQVLLDAVSLVGQRERSDAAPASA